MLINEGLEELAQKRYEEAKKAGVTSIVLNEEQTGGLMLYINQKPKVPLLSFEVGTDKLYVGADTMTETP
ncbi:MAG: hypothetical protein WDN09_04200 [bacterium]